ncbi:MAG: roadblock/LC7 domain-containing protein [Thermoplasmatales archaeon]|nr:roadblock/LC7 domain-containing protein [Thermoplasmatales archaeon]
MKSMTKNYKEILRELEMEKGVEGVFIVSRDGLPVYTNIENFHVEVFSAMVATILSSAEIAIDEIKGGVPKFVVIEGKNRKIVVGGAGPDYLIAVVTSPDVEFLDLMQKIGKELGKND